MVLSAYLLFCKGIGIALSIEWNEERLKQHRTLQGLRYGISRVSELGANAMWCSEAEHFCAVATLFPVDSTSTKAGQAKLLSDPSLWAMWDKNVLYMAGNANNAFTGTPEERRNFMLQWSIEMVTKLRDGENIVNEGSDLRVPHFTVTEEVTEEVTIVPEVITAEELTPA